MNEFVFIALWVVGIGLVLHGITKTYDKPCPKCGSELEDVGYEGYKKWCPTCGWRNYGGKK